MGRGIDLNKRKIWQMYDEGTILQVILIFPLFISTNFVELDHLLWWILWRRKIFLFRKNSKWNQTCLWNL